MGRLNGLDLLRGVAALLVTLWHVEGLYFSTAYFSKSYLAVDLFFMLSGYVMARSYEGRIRTGLSVVDFMKIRVERLWPVLVAGIFVGAILLETSIPVQSFIPALFLALLFLPSNFAPPSLFPFNGPAWSLFYELVANLAHALLFVKLSTRTLLWALPPLVILLAVTMEPFDKLAAGMTAPTMIPNLFRVLVPYIIGIVLFRAELPALSRTQIWTVIACSVAVLSLAPPLWFDIGFVLIACPLLLIAGLKVQVGRWAVALGALSFPLYAVHYPVISMVYRIGGRPEVALVCAIILGAALTFLKFPRRSSAQACSRVPS